MRQQLNVDWSRKVKKIDLKPALKRYQRYLAGLGFSKQTIESYVFRAGKYLEFCKTDQPTEEDYQKFRDILLERQLARNTLNNYGFATRKYHEMINKPVNFTYLKPRDIIPDCFNEDEIARILSVCGNLKHYCMLVVLFYQALRASELCGLNDGDINWEAKTLRVRGKWNREDIQPLHPESEKVIIEYLAVRPTITIDGAKPLFVTDYLNRMCREDISRIFHKYKKLAGVTSKGGCHVWGRHSSASLMIRNGSDILTVSKIMRHNDIRTTMRYLHTFDQTVRERYVSSLTL